LGSLSENWFSDLQLLESGSERKICQTVIRETFSDPLIICCDVYSDSEAERVLLLEITPDI
jgi:hypothetical protein